MNIAEQITQLAKDYSAEQDKVTALFNVITRPRIGINTHLFSDPSYEDIDKVIRCINQLNIKYVRQDFFIDEKGQMTRQYPYEKFLEAGIEVRPMVYSYGLDTSGAKEYDKGFAVGNGFATSYGTMFKEIELGNELAIKCLITGKTGDKKEHYDPRKLDAVCQFVKGMYMGVLASGKPLRMVINCEWLHYYFIDTLRKDYGVCTNISWHHYTDADANSGNFISKPIEQFLKDKYGPYFTDIGETNYMPGVAASEQVQVAKFIPLFRRLLSSNVGVYLFELFDRVNSKSREGQLGLFKSDGTAKLIVGELGKIL